MINVESERDSGVRRYWEISGGFLYRRRAISHARLSRVVSLASRPRGDCGLRLDYSSR